MNFWACTRLVALKLLIGKKSKLIERERKRERERERVSVCNYSKREKYLWNAHMYIYELWDVSDR